jgi:hypothetical protein
MISLFPFSIGDLHNGHAFDGKSASSMVLMRFHALHLSLIHIQA